MKLISVTAIGAFQRATKDGYQRVIRKKYNKAEFQDISQLFPVFFNLVVFEKACLLSQKRHKEC